MKFFKNGLPDYSSATAAELREEKVWAERQKVLFSPMDPAYRGAMICLRRIKEEHTKRLGLAAYETLP